MKTKLIFGLLIICLIIAGCSNTGEVVKEVRDQITTEDINKVIVCPSSYIRYGVDCCLDSNSNNICDNDESVNQQVKSQCVGTIGSGDIYIKGTILGTQNDIQYEKTDYCSSENSNILKEYVCDTTNESGWRADTISCNNGCNNGICVKETQENNYISKSEAENVVNEFMNYLSSLATSDGSSFSYQIKSSYLENGYWNVVITNNFNEIVIFEVNTQTGKIEYLKGENGEDRISFEEYKKEIENICIDSDSGTNGGRDYYTKGKISGAMISEDILREDFCISETKLREVFCLNNKGTPELYDCPNGCNNGACIKETNTQQSCENIGLHIYKTELNGFTILITIKNTGSEDIEKITYYFYKGDMQAGTVGDSPGLKAYETNTFEVARGRGPNVKVTATPYITINGEITSCKDKEYIFYGDDYKEIQSSCTDSDNGSIYIKGVITVNQVDGISSEKTDYCSAENPNMLKEYLCSEGSESSKIVSCANGCSNGACIQ